MPCKNDIQRNSLDSVLSVGGTYILSAVCASEFVINYLCAG